MSLKVWFGEMPESNGRRNWTASLYQEGRSPHMEGFCFVRSEYPDRARYEADRMKWVIGQAEKPDILSYDTDLHSGYKPYPGEYGYSEKDLNRMVEHTLKAVLSELVHHQRASEIVQSIETKDLIKSFKEEY